MIRKVKILGLEKGKCIMGNENEGYKYLRRSIVQKIEELCEA